MKKNQKTIGQEGFGMVELLITVIILGIGLFGLMNLMGSLMRADQYSTSDFIALNYAREGVEVIRNKRDTNWIQGQAWDFGLSEGTDYTATLNFDIPTGVWDLNFEPDSINDNLSRLYTDMNTKITNHQTSGEQTQFSRLLSLLPICFDDISQAYTTRNEEETCLGTETKVGIEVHSKVLWNDGSLPEGRETELVSTIYNWR